MSDGDEPISIDQFRAEEVRRLDAAIAWIVEGMRGQNVKLTAVEFRASVARRLAAGKGES